MHTALSNHATVHRRFGIIRGFKCWHEQGFLVRSFKMRISIGFQRGLINKREYDE